MLLTLAAMYQLVANQTALNETKLQIKQLLELDGDESSPLLCVRSPACSSDGILLKKRLISTPLRPSDMNDGSHIIPIFLV